MQAAGLFLKNFMVSCKQMNGGRIGHKTKPERLIFKRRAIIGGIAQGHAQNRRIVAVNMKDKIKIHKVRH